MRQAFLAITIRPWLLKTNLEPTSSSCSCPNARLTFAICLLGFVRQRVAISALFMWSWSSVHMAKQLTASEACQMPYDGYFTISCLLFSFYHSC